MCCNYTEIEDICPKMAKTTQNLCTGLLLEVNVKSWAHKITKLLELHPYKIIGMQQLFQLDLEARDHTEGGFKKW